MGFLANINKPFPAYNVNRSKQAETKWQHDKFELDDNTDIKMDTT